VVAGVAKLPNLARFSLSDNCLRSLPNCVGSMLSLTMLDLERNEMDQFAPIHMLQNVKILKLKRNFLKNIPPEIEKMRALEYFDVSENQVCVYEVTGLIRLVRA